MTKNETQRTLFLELYGHDTNRWPITVSEQEKQIIKTMPEYISAYNIDTTLNQTDWPSPSPDLFKKTIEAVHETEKDNYLPPFISAQSLALIQRPTFLASCFALFLCLGLTIGLHYQNASANNSDAYRYFSSGPVYYAYATPIKGFYNE